MDLSNVFAPTIHTNSYQTNELTSTTPTEEYYLLYVKITEGGNSQLEWVTINSTDMTYELEKGAAYLLGIAKKTDNGIKTQGIISTQQEGLSVIPISMDATNVLDLGKIIEGEDEFYTQVDVNQLSEAVGYTKETIEALNGYDVTLKHFLNPDINGDGVFDNEQDIWWLFLGNYDFNFVNIKGYYLDNGEINYTILESPDKYLNESVGLVFMIDYDELKKISPNANDWNVIVKVNGIDKYTSDWKVTGEKEFQFYFTRLDREPITLQDLEKGTYEIILSCGEKSYTFTLDNVENEHSTFITKDCSGFVFYCLKEALKKHDNDWFLETGYKGPVFEDVRKYNYPNTPIEVNMFFNGEKYVSYADAYNLLHYNVRFVSYDRNYAKPGDLIFYFHPEDPEFPYHVMIYTGNGFVYHTGPEGEIRYVSYENMVLGDMAWRPIDLNPAFLGYYRLKILSD